MTALRPAYAAIRPDHEAEPETGTIRRSSGEKADLFNMAHYPLYASCRQCGNPIEAQGFLYPFIHAEAVNA